jgi:hypothetical protein
LIQLKIKIQVNQKLLELVPNPEPKIVNVLFPDDPEDGVIDEMFGDNVLS